MQPIKTLGNFAMESPHYFVYTCTTRRPIVMAQCPWNFTSKTMADILQMQGSIWPLVGLSLARWQPPVAGVPLVPWCRPWDDKVPGWIKRFLWKWLGYNFGGARTPWRPTGGSISERMIILHHALAVAVAICTFSEGMNVSLELTSNTQSALIEPNSKNNSASLF